MLRTLDLVVLSSGMLLELQVGLGLHAGLHKAVHLAGDEMFDCKPMRDIQGLQ